MIKSINNFVYNIKLYFSDRQRYESLIKYKKLQRDVRKKLKKAAKSFCPWSGYYMHNIIFIMLKFYSDVYSEGLCCWSETDRIKKISSQIEKALKYAYDLDTFEHLSEEELVAIAEKEYGFKKYVEKWEKKFNTKANPKLMYGIAYDYFEKKYTEGMYNTIGKHIWEWCD